MDQLEDCLWDGDTVYDFFHCGDFEYDDPDPDDHYFDGVFVSG